MIFVNWGGTVVQWLALWPHSPKVPVLSEYSSFLQPPEACWDPSWPHLGSAPAQLQHVTGVNRKSWLNEWVGEMIFSQTLSPKWFIPVLVEEKLPLFLVSTAPHGPEYIWELSRALQQEPTHRWLHRRLLHLQVKGPKTSFLIFGSNGDKKTVSGECPQRHSLNICPY